MKNDELESESVVRDHAFQDVTIEQSDKMPSMTIVQCQDGEKNFQDNSSEINQCEAAAPQGDEGMREGEDEVVRRVRSKETRRRRTKGLGGLQLEKTGIWTLRCLINGKRVSKSTGTRDRAEAEQFAKRFLAPYVKDDAERTFENIQAAVMTERQLAAMREAEGPQLKLSDMWSAYVASPMRRDLAETTLAGKEQVVRKFVEYMNTIFPEAIEVRHVTRYHTENYLNYLRKDHSASTYNNRLCVLREVYRTVMAKAAAKENPWEGFPLRPDDSHTRRELTIEELARLVDMASREGVEFRTLFGIAMYTGLRLGDCCKLTWAEVDIVRSIIQKVPEKTKKYRKGRPVTIPIHKVLADLLMQTPLDERRGYVLPQIGEWASLGARGMGRIHHRIGKIFHNAGIVTSVAVEGRKWKAPEASFHSLRHTFVSMSANAGVPLHIVQAIVGHESTAMTRHYYHENVAALQKAVEAIPSISETGDVSAGGVAQAALKDQIGGLRRIGNGSGFLVQRNYLPQTTPSPQRLELGMKEEAEHSSAISTPVDIVEEQAVTVVSTDGVERVNPHADAPLMGRNAERNVQRREDKLAAVEAANADARNLGGWGESAYGTGNKEEVIGNRVETGNGAGTMTSGNRKSRNEWIARCVRRWCQGKKASLLEGTSKLVGNGGYRFLQELWESGGTMSIEDALDALEVFLKAKGV